MSGYPLLLDGDQVSALVVGGGTVACRKALALLDSGATVRVVAPDILPALRDAAARHRRLTLLARPYASGDIGLAVLVVAATNARSVNAQVAREAAALGRLVNVADQPSEGNCATVAVHRAGALVIGVSAGGVPVAARRIRDAIAARFDGRYAAVLAALAALRTSGRTRGAASDAPGWAGVERDVLGADFCAAVESGAVATRLGQWR